MKKIIQLLTIASVALFFGAVTSFAQSSTSIKGNIPFDFSVGNKTLKKGSYELTVAKDSSSSALITIIDEKGDRTGSVLGLVRFNGNKKAELVFARDGEKRFLTSVTILNYTVEIPSARTNNAAIASESAAAVADLVVGMN